MAGFPGLKSPPADLNKGAVVSWFREIWTVVNNMLDGGMNVTGTVTLTASAASTTLNDNRIGGSSWIGLMPTTANASAEIGAGTIYIGTVGQETATITHANNAQVDRTFRYVILG